MGSAIHLLTNYLPPMACYEATFSFLHSVKEISTMMSFIHSSTTSRLIQLTQGVILLSYRVADKSLARLGRKQANVSVRMA